jgi:hypothetical protein
LGYRLSNTKCLGLPINKQAQALIVTVLYDLPRKGNWHGESININFYSSTIKIEVWYDEIAIRSKKLRVNGMTTLLLKRMIEFTTWSIHAWLCSCFSYPSMEKYMWNLPYILGVQHPIFFCFEDVRMVITNISYGAFYFFITNYSNIFELVLHMYGIQYHCAYFSNDTS